MSTLAAGTVVKLVGGTFAGMTGEVVADSGSTVSLSLTVFGRRMPVSARRADVEVLGSQRDRWLDAVAHRRRQVIELHDQVWWAHEAPDDPLAAAREVDGVRARRVHEADEGVEAMVAWIDANEVTEAALRAELDRVLPRPPQTAAVATAIAEGRVTAGGAPKLTEAELDALRALRRRAAERSRASRIAVAVASLPPDPEGPARRARALEEVAAGADTWRERFGRREATEAESKPRSPGLKSRPTEPTERRLKGRFAQAVGLTLPDHAFTHEAFWRGLSDAEREVLHGPVGVSAGMLSDWFREEPPAPIEGRDPRLHGRFTQTPPGLVHALWGDTDGLHWGLWFDRDDAPEVPLTGGFHGRDGTEVGLGEGTLLQVVLERIRECEGELEREEVPGRDVTLARLDGIVRWLRECQPDALGHRPPPAGRVATADGAGVPGPAPDLPPVHERADAIRTDHPVVADWVAAARRALADGDPMPALVLGRDLHWCWSRDRPEHQQWAAELMAGAHRLRGAPGLAAIAEAHAGPARFHAGISAVRQASET